MLVERVVKLCLFSWVVVLLAITTVSADTCRGSRLALVIGNSTYPDNDTPLREPLGNARLVAGGLRKIGFDTDVGEDLTKARMQATLERFEAKIETDSLVFLFYSGFGLQSGGHTYLIPTDAVIWSDADVRAYGFNLDRILAEIDSRGAKARIVVLDAARRNPFERRFRAIGSAGLAPISGAAATLAMYSNVPGAAFDEGSGTTSPFVEELAKEMTAPKATAEETFRRTRVDLSHMPQVETRPWISSSLEEDVALDPHACRDDGNPTRVASPQPQIPAKVPAPVLQPPPAPPVSQAAVEPPVPAPKAVGTDPAAKPTVVALSDPALIEEARNRLFEQNLDPGAVGSVAMTEAVRKYEKQVGLPETDGATDILLESLRKADSLKPWGAIVLAGDAKRWGMSWGRPSRQQALTEARSRCGSKPCPREVSFFGSRCGAFALSSRSWAITWRSKGDVARKAALDDCEKRGASCRLIGAVCADGSGRSR